MNYNVYKINRRIRTPLKTWTKGTFSGNLDTYLACGWLWRRVSGLHHQAKRLLKQKYQLTLYKRRIQDKGVSVCIKLLSENSGSESERSMATKKTLLNTWCGGSTWAVESCQHSTDKGTARANRWHKWHLCEMTLGLAVSISEYDSDL